MGCTGSKQAGKFRGGGGGPRPFFRSHSLPFRRSSRRSAAGDIQHTVSLTSSTFGSLRLDHPGYDPVAAVQEDDSEGSGGGRDEAMMKSLNDGLKREVIEGNEKGSKTPTVTPPNTPEIINAWEMMEGLDDVSPVGYRSTEETADRSFSFPAAVPLPDVAGDKADGAKAIVEENSAVEDKNEALVKMSLVKARINAFQEKINARRAMANAARAAAVVVTKSCKLPPSGEGKVVLYFTSLRSVRKTYEDCCEALVILRGYGVRIDERDVSMHAGFKDELNGILGVVSGGLRLPRIFADGRYLGGADEIREMHETGELVETLRSCTAPLAMKGGIAACTACGDVRFVPCKVCSGSCKVFVEEEVDEEGRGGDGGAVGFRRCQECNENGLVRCSLCCSC